MVDKLRNINKALLYGFIAMILIFSYLSYRTSVNQHKIQVTQQKIQTTQAQLAKFQHDQAVYNFHQCERAAFNATNYNQATKVFVQFLQEANKVRHDPEIQRWIEIQQSSTFIVPECGDAP